MLKVQSGHQKSESAEISSSTLFSLTAAKSSNAADRRVAIITPRSLVYRLLLSRENEGLRGHGEASEPYLAS